MIGNGFGTGYFLLCIVERSLDIIVGAILKIIFSGCTRGCSEGVGRGQYGTELLKTGIGTLCWGGAWA